LPFGAATDGSRPTVIRDPESRVRGEHRANAEQADEPSCLHRRKTVTGPGEIVATDNGDPTDFDPFPSHDRNAFNGLALVIVRALPGQPGRIHMTASADGLQRATVDVTGHR
jgi:hypothetical protein